MREVGDSSELRVDCEDAVKHPSGARVDVSVLVPVLNEEQHIEATVAAMQAQRFEGTFELLFADGRSEDRTREILLRLAESDPRIRVLDNPRRGTASGLNVCLGAARGEFVARMDAHTYYEDRYLEAGVQRIRSGDTDWVSGPAVPIPTGPVSRAVTLALGSWLGRGGSRKWSEDAQAGGERELDTGVFGGVWRREVVLAIGGWDERWPVNQDSEMAARFLDRGARLVCLPEMAADMCRAIPCAGLPASTSATGSIELVLPAPLAEHAPISSHRAGPCWRSAGRSCRAPTHAPPARAGLGSYLAAVLATGIATGLRTRRPSDAVTLTLVLPIMHLGWGFGTLAGVLRFGPPTKALAHALGLCSGEILRRRRRARVCAVPARRTGVKR